MGFKFIPLASGSSGNAIYIGGHNSGLLVDCGLSGRETKNRLESLGVDIRKLSGIILTHEHIDHIKGAGVICRRFGTPIYSLKETFEAGAERLGSLDKTLKRELPPKINLDGIEVEFFPLPHDAAAHIGLQLSYNQQKIIIATDLGHANGELKARLPQADIILIEANHDRDMLDNGPYPLALKKRILSKQGHLSNDDCGELLAEVLQQKPTQVYLGHLSAENNNPQIAQITVENILKAKGILSENLIRLEVAQRSCNSSAFSLI